jgi:hypothetical protein
MNDFKIGDFVRSDTSDVFIGIVVGDNELGNFHVAWNDGDITYSENYTSMFPYEIQPSDWTDYLYKAFSDFFCP